eukprot:gene3969-9378_t
MAAASLAAKNSADARACAGCGRYDVQLLRCAVCKAAYYCSP